MKTSIAITAALLLSTLATLAQGTVNFSTRVSGTVVGHVYAHDPGSQYGYKVGNTANETPAGTQTYSGARLEGSDFSAQLWAANGANQQEYALLPVSPVVPFRTGATLGGTPTPIVLQIAAIPAGGTGTFQVRAWYNRGGTITSYESASTRNRSLLFTVSNLGDGILTLPADLAGFRSFNITGAAIPEPHVLTLLGLAGGATVCFFPRRIRRQRRSQCT